VFAFTSKEAVRRLSYKDALTKFYGQGLSLQALPRRQQVEQVPKNQILQALQKATKGTKKRAYHKTDHGFALLKLIDPAKVRSASPHFRRLCEVLGRAASR
jgi:hypothetical protein